jgi:hypothetical protein
VIEETRLVGCPLEFFSVGEPQTYHSRLCLSRSFFGAIDACSMRQF